MNLTIEMKLSCVSFANNIKAEYDTPQCRNKANIYKSRNKNK